MKETRLQRVVNALERFPFDARTHFAGLLALIGYCAYEAVASMSYCEPWKWAWPVISAVGLILIVIRVAARIDNLLSRALRRLYERGVIACSEDEFGQLNATLALLRRKQAPVWGLAIGPAIILAFTISMKWGVACRPALFEPLRMALLAVEAPIFYGAGYYIGWMVVQGRLARVLRTLGITYSVQPGHPDGAAGLRPLGDFFLRQAMLAGLPAAYVASWLAFFPNYLTGSRTKPVFLILLPIFVFIEVAVFIWPMWSFHRVMLHQKHAFVTKADEIARRISSTQAELREPMDPAQLKELSAQLELDLRLYEDLEGLPTWPVSKQIQRRFALQNLILVGPPLLSLLFSGQLFDAVKVFFGGG